MKYIACITLAVFSLFMAGLYADGFCADVEFKGPVSSLVFDSEGVGALFITVNDFQIRVQVDDRTDLTNGSGEAITLSQIRANDIVKIRGQFSSAGILASEVELLDDVGRDFFLRGAITAVSHTGMATILTVLGTNVTVTPQTRISSGGALLTSSSLTEGVVVLLEGTISGRTFTATSVNVNPGGRQPVQLRFQGTIVSVVPCEVAFSPAPELPAAPCFIQVQVGGTTAVTTVSLESNTFTVGNIQPGAPVVVEGVLSPNLSVQASKVSALSALEIRPAERKLQVGESAQFTVVLQQPAAVETIVSLSSASPAIVGLSANSVTIPQGQWAANFGVAGVSLGVSTITAQALGKSATASVAVGQVSTQQNEQPNSGNPTGQTGQGQPNQNCARIKFAPDHIQMTPGETREVVLIIQPPQKIPVTVNFGSSNTMIAKVASFREFNNGAAELKVLIQAGPNEGTASLIGMLPTSLCGGSAELLVQVSSKPGQETGTGQGDPQTQPAQIKFEPGKLEIKVGDTRIVNLIMSRSFDTPTSVTINNSNPGFVKAPSSVTIPARDKHVQVTLEGVKEGSATISATLGSSVATVAVTVRGKK